MKRISLICATFALALSASAQVVKTDFLKGYKAGDKLEKQTYESATAPIITDQWCAAFDTRHTPDMPSPTVTEGLTYPGYPKEKLAIDLTAFPKEVKGANISVYSLTDNRGTYRSGSYYLAFLGNIKAAPGGLGEFLSFDISYVGNVGRGKLFLKRTEDRKQFVASCAARRVPEGMETKAFDYNKTHLFVLKMDFDKKEMSLFIDPDMSGAEPKADLVVPQGTEGEIKNAIRGIKIRHSRNIRGTVGGFRFANTWKDAIGK